MLIVLVTLITLLLQATPAPAAPPRAEILGTWRGTSICVKNSGHAACHDETVIYHFSPSPTRADAVSCNAEKMVGGKPEPMGVLDFTYDPRRAQWVCEYRGPSAHGLWSFAVRRNAIVGTLVDLPSRKRVRDVRVRRA